MANTDQIRPVDNIPIATEFGQRRYYKPALRKKIPVVEANKPESKALTVDENQVPSEFKHIDELA